MQPGLVWNRSVPGRPVKVVARETAMTLAGAIGVEWRGLPVVGDGARPRNEDGEHGWR